MTKQSPTGKQLAVLRLAKDSLNLLANRTGTKSAQTRSIVACRLAGWLDKADWLTVAGARVLEDNA